MNTATTDVTVELSVDDFELAKDFYRQLGFAVAWEEPAAGMNGYLVMYRQNSILCFFCGNDQVQQHPYFRQFPRDTIHGHGVEISIPVEDIDEFYDEVAKKIDQKHIFQPLKQQPWGKKDFRLVDPFGYFLRFNEPWNVLEYIPLEMDYV